MLENAATTTDSTATSSSASPTSSEIEALQQRLREQAAQIRYLEEVVRILRADRYGPKREKLTEPPGQAQLFNEIEVTAALLEHAQVEPELAATPLREPKSASTDKAGRRALAAHLPRRIVRYELPEAERHCPCGGHLTEFSVLASEQLHIIPAKVEVIRHERVKYTCTACSQNVRTAAAPPQILPRSNASAGLLAHLVTAKYVDGLPLHRQETVFERHDVRLSRATQAAWMIALEQPLTPLLNLMRERLLGSGYIRIDETPLQVLKSEKAAQSEHWMWVRVAGPPGQRLILFEHDPSRGAHVARRLLEGATGYVQSDGYAVYDGVAAELGLTHVGCFAHARRRFFEAVKALPAGARTETAAHEAVRRIDALYAIERELKAAEKRARSTGQPFDPAIIAHERQARAMPLLQSLHAWALERAAATLPSGKLGEAFAYLLGQWPKLIRYTLDPRLALDTNLAENAIRPFALGRRNWLFADTVKGARASATLYSLVETAKANGLEPYAYLKNLFEQLPLATCVEHFEALLPIKPVQVPESS